MDDTDPIEWAADDVVAERVALFNSKYLDYTIDSIREVTEAELEKLKG